jgi:hypothetical protein
MEIPVMIVRESDARVRIRESIEKVVRIRWLLLWAQVWADVRGPCDADHWVRAISIRALLDEPSAATSGCGWEAP